MKLSANLLDPGNLAKLLFPVSSAIVLAMTAQVSQAAVLDGDTETNFDGGFTLGAGPTLATLSSNSLIFTPELAPISLSQQEGDFLESFNSAAIGNIQSFSNPLIADDPFLDFGNLSLVPGVVGFGGEGSIADGVNTFTLSELYFDVAQSGANVSVDIALYGAFEDELGNTVDGAGNITLQANNLSVEEFVSTLQSGGSITSSFSGAAFTTSVDSFAKDNLSQTLIAAANAESVPEPAHAFGVALALGLGYSFKKTLASKLSSAPAGAMADKTAEAR